MISKTQGILSKSGSTVKALAGSHPVALGIVIGVGAYYVINKYWLNEDEEIMTAEASESEEDAPA